jgi:hypothetical protein
MQEIRIQEVSFRSENVDDAIAMLTNYLPLDVPITINSLDKHSIKLQLVCTEESFDSDRLILLLSDAGYELSPFAKLCAKKIFVN